MQIMKKLLMLAVSLVAVAALASVSLAAAPAAPAKPAHAMKVAATTKTTMGAVTGVTAGKHFEVKDEKGKMHKFSIGKHTKINGDLKVGAKVTVTSKGRWAEEVKVEGSPAPAAAPAAPAAPEKY
jgi:opacity protein-like surface antigen